MQEPQEKLKIRRFLLDDMEADEREQLEELFFSDSDFQEEVLIAENELIDDYLSGELDQADREKFQQVFESNPTQQKKLRIAQTVHDYARKEFAGTLKRRKKSYVYLAIAAAVLVFLLGGLWLVWQTSSRQQAQQNDAHRDIEKQLTAATATAAGSIESPQAKVTPLVLASISTRAFGSETTLSLGSGAEAFDLWLLPTATEYEFYNAALRKIGTHDQFNLPHLQAQTGKQGKMVRLRVPANLFGRGVYEVALTAVAANGQSVDAGKFTFQITD